MYYYKVPHEKIFITAHEVVEILYDEAAEMYRVLTKDGISYLVCTDVFAKRPEIYPMSVVNTLKYCIED